MHACFGNKKLGLINALYAPIKTASELFGRGYSMHAFLKITLDFSISFGIQQVEPTIPKRQ